MKPSFNCKVSVVMGVRNGAAWLDSSLSSIAAQSWQNFEVVIVDDNSSDGTKGIVEAWMKRDARFRILSHENRGLAAALNQGIAHSRGELIARMDADDCMRPDRLALQVKAMYEDKALNLCGMAFRLFGAGRMSTVRPPQTNAAIHARMLFGSPFAHPTVMMRRSLLQVVRGPYDENLDVAQDYDLWVRLAAHFRAANLSAVGLDYRQHDQQNSKIRASARRLVVRGIQARYLEALGVVSSESDLLAHEWASVVSVALRPVDLTVVEEWLTRLQRVLTKQHTNHGTSYAAELGEGWYRAVRRTGNGLYFARRYLLSPLAASSRRRVWRALRIMGPRVQADI